MRDLPNLGHLFALPVIDRRGSLSAAAEELHLSQSALTQALRGLERRCGEALFDRGRAGMAPTDAGRLLLARIERAVAWLRSADRGAGAFASRAPRLTAAQLRALIAVTEAGSFNLAARRLGLAQPGVYRAARALEAACGEPLFRRAPTGAEATPRARRLARHASLALAEIRHGLEEVDEWRGLRQGLVSVGCLPLARPQILPEAVNGLLRLRPDVTVRIVDGPYEELLHELRHGQIDLLVGALRDPPPTTDIDQEELFRDPLAIVVRAAHPLLRRRRRDVTAAALARLRWIVPRTGTPARDAFERFFAGRKTALPRHAIECSSLAATRGLLLGSDSAALLSARQVRLELRAGQLAVLLDALPGTDRPIGITRRRNWPPTPVLEIFLDALRQSARL